MGLLHPSPGECYDRISILNLKIDHSKDNESVCNSFIDERVELEAYLESYPGRPSISRTSYSVEALDKINTSLWALEDYVRSNDRKNLLDDYKLITALNDKRQKFIKTINNVYGIIKVEKLYEQSK